MENALARLPDSTTGKEKETANKYMKNTDKKNRQIDSRQAKDKAVQRLREKKERKKEGREKYKYNHTVTSSMTR